jgi:hypothetical protein
MALLKIEEGKADKQLRAPSPRQENVEFHHRTTKIFGNSSFFSRLSGGNKLANIGRPLSSGNIHCED